MKVLVVGRAGREHAIARYLSRDRTSEVFCAPGNPGMQDVAQCVPLSEDDAPGLTAWCRHAGVDVVVIGAAEPLVAGLADGLRAAGFAVVGPSRRGALLEASKRRTRLLCRRLQIPSPGFRLVRDAKEALANLDGWHGPVVIKLDGLQGGKGTYVASDRASAVQWLRARCGAEAVAGRGIVLEERLHGEELSFTAAIDGERIVPLARVRDYKRRGDRDTGSNTGGMGSWSGPGLGAPLSDEEIVERFITPVLADLRASNIVYRGFLYAGLMLTSGGPKLLEFNVRLGDSEAQTILTRLKSPLSDLLLATALGDLVSLAAPHWSSDFAVSVTLARRGYPDARTYPLVPLHVPADLAAGEQVHFASVVAQAGKLFASGGRVLHVTSAAATLRDASQGARELAGRILCEDAFHRSDIGAAD